MTGRLLALITGTVVAVLLAVAAMAAVIGGASSACLLPPSSSSAGSYDTEQLHNATTIVQVATDRGLPSRAAVIAVATAIQESDLHNSGQATDHDSVGLFQQRPSQGWGTAQQLLDPVYAAGKFYDTLVTVADWQALPLTQAAQAVQNSAYPDAYAQHEADAAVLVTRVVSGNPSAIPGDLEHCVSICPSVTGPADGGTYPCGDVTAVFVRARSWLTAWSGGPVPYRSSNAAGDLLGGYRRDCSGYVSMARGLPGPGLNTVDLAARSTVLTKIDLRPGDLMINPAPDLQGHVVLFERWADASMGSYWGYEQSGDGGTHYRKIPYPYFGSYPMKPYRFGN